MTYHEYNEYKEGDWARVVATVDDLNRSFIRNVNTNDLVVVSATSADGMAVVASSPGRTWTYRNEYITPAFQPGERYRVKDGVNLRNVFLDKDHYGHIGVVGRSESVHGHLRIFLQLETAIGGCVNFFYWPEHLEYVGPKEEEKEMAPTQATEALVAAMDAYKIKIRDAILAEREDQDLEICDEGLKKFFDKLGIPWEPDENWTLVIDPSNTINETNRDDLIAYLSNLGVVGAWVQNND